VRLERVGVGMKTCLVVDDSSVIRKVARRILEDFEFTVTEAEDGRYALDVCMRSMPDLVLLDWHLPVMDGLDFLQKLRQMDGGKRPKVVFCASEADVAQIARALRAGADEYLLKPFDRATVETKLHEVGML
jgi:two-component system, chemotaxis family, chemotaxis protein CheY